MSERSKGQSNDTLERSEADARGVSNVVEGWLEASRVMQRSEVQQ